MSELIAAPADPQVVVEELEHVIEAVSHPPIVITEQQLAFSTAAAAALPRTKPTRGVIAALRAMFLSSCTGRTASLSTAARRLSRGRRHGTRNAQAVIAFLTLLAPMLVPHAAIGEVRGVHRARHADTATIQ